MNDQQTEARHWAADGLELRSPQDILSLLAAGQVSAAQSVESACAAMVPAAKAMAGSIEVGGRLVYVAAGSSGLMALADALELPGTYGIPRNRIVVLLAGGMEALTSMTGGPEDDGQAGRLAIEALGLDERDCVIALTASGHTPYAVEALKTAKATGARTIGLSNNPGTAILAEAEFPICLPTPAEVIAGSTRMGAGTAQKIALNMLSTMMAIHLGHVHDGFMVNVVADNAKLRGRARGIVSAIAGVDADAATHALETSNGDVKQAVLLAAGAVDGKSAMALLDSHRGRLRPALEALSVEG